MATESKEFPGFYHIPGYDGFVINKEGLVINVFQHWFVPRRYDPKRYIYVKIGHGRENTKNAAVHLLVARTFLPRPSDDPTLQVNHIDGNRYNPRLENLEWITPKENTWHAGRMGLTEHCKPIQVRNYATGLVNEYPCMEEYANRIGECPDAIRYLVKHGDNGRRIYEDGCQYRLMSKEVWPTDTYHQPRFRPSELLVRNIKTFEETEFHSLNDTSKFLCKDPHTVAGYLKTGFQPVFWPGFQVKYNDGSEWRELRDSIIEVCDTNCTKPVQMYNPITGESRVFVSKLACERLTGISAGHLINLLRTRTGASHRRYDLKNPIAFGYYPIFSDMSLPLESLEW